ncbi:hypothetical protein GCM10009422_11920 [Brevundimonas kwangchunensis]|uniref:DUF2178 domain-containing protein n=1 Tax=Brevundimonas kwangchunensis TaxID=322163 RepID=A0ABP3S0K0_9CAUL
MDDAALQTEVRKRRGLYRGALIAAALGSVATAVGFVVGLPKTGDEATGWGVLAGAGLVIALAGVISALLLRPGRHWTPEGEQTKRDRLQGQRAYQLWLFPLVTLAFLVQATFALQDILSGEGGFGDYLSVALPVIYAWIVAAIAMGWDHLTRTNKRYMEDELTSVLRARAIAAAFIVMMAGGTIAFGLGLWRTDAAVVALPFVLAAGGAAAGIRYAWLDREFGKDG